MDSPDLRKPIRLAIAGLGNCASSLIEGLSVYHCCPDNHVGLLFPVLAGYALKDIELVAAFEVSARKVVRPVCVAFNEVSNDFVLMPNAPVVNDVVVQLDLTLDGNPMHLARMVNESEAAKVDAAQVLKDARAQVIIDLPPT